MWKKVKFYTKRSLQWTISLYLVLFLFVLIEEAVNGIICANMCSRIIYCPDQENCYPVKGFDLPGWTNINPTENWNNPADWTLIDYTKEWGYNSFE